MLKKTGWIAALMMASAFVLGACGGGGKTCQDAAKNVAKLMFPDDAAKQAEQVKDVADECVKQKYKQNSIDCAANAKTVEELQKCPRDKG